MSTSEQSSAFRAASETRVCAVTANTSLLMAAPCRAIIVWGGKFLIIH